MRKFIIISLLCGIGLFASASFFNVATARQDSKFKRSSKPIANQYIVVLNEDHVGRSAETTVVEAEAYFLSSVYGGSVRDVYSTAIKGYAAMMSPAEAEALSRSERVAFVEEDAEISVSSTQVNAPWNLDRVDQRSLPLDTSYQYSQDGAGAHVYILDTGIRISHQDFGGRANVVFDALNDGQNGLDCNGHGTHVAGTVGGATYGVAKGVSLHSVRVLPCGGSGQISDLITGVDWVTANRINPAVANISITAPGSSPAMETAISNSIASGVTFTIAAGNSAWDACDYTPARTPNAITVAATAEADQRALYSNYGPCVDLFAPGNSVISTGHASDSATRVLSGTSMSAPLVAGIAAIYRSANLSANPAAVRQAINAATTTGVVTGIDGTSPNKLLYSWLSGGPVPTPTPTPTATPTPTPTPTPAGAGQIKIKKRVLNPGGGPSANAVFPYAATNIPTSSFTLINDQEFVDPSVPGSSQVVSVTESSVAGWRLVSVECVEVAGGSPNIPNTTVDLTSRRANIAVEDGETVTCTFTSEELIPTAGDATVSGRIVDNRGYGARGVTLSLFNAASGEVAYTTTNAFGFYSFSELEVTNFYVLSALGFKRYTIVDNERSFVLNDDLANMDFVAESTW